MPAVKKTAAPAAGSRAPGKSPAKATAAKKLPPKRPAAARKVVAAKTVPGSATRPGSDWHQALLEVTGGSELAMHGLHDRVRDYVVKNNLRPSAPGGPVQLDQNLKVLVDLFRKRKLRDIGERKKTIGNDPGPMIVLDPNDDPGPMIIGAAIKTSLQIIGGEGLENDEGEKPSQGGQVGRSSSGKAR